MKTTTIAPRNARTSGQDDSLTQEEKTPPASPQQACGPSCEDEERRRDEYADESDKDYV